MYCSIFWSQFSSFTFLCSDFVVNLKQKHFEISFALFPFSFLDFQKQKHSINCMFCDKKIKFSECCPDQAG